MFHAFTFSNAVQQQACFLLLSLVNIFFPSSYFSLKVLATTFGRCSLSFLLGGFDIQLLYFLGFFIFPRVLLSTLTLD